MFYVNRKEKNMKKLDFLLTKKWIGAAVFLLFCLGYSLYVGSMASNITNMYIPIIKNNAADFLPITIENGMISKPQNTKIEKVYGEGAEKFKAVLDTRTEEFEPSLLTESGIYISRAAVYTVNSAKNEVRINSLRDVPNMVVDQEVVNAFLSGVEGYVMPVIVSLTFLGFVLYGLIIIGIYSLILHWIMSACYKAPYNQTLRITVYSYVLISLLSAFSLINHTFWLGFILAAVANFVVNNSKANTKEQAA